MRKIILSVCLVVLLAYLVFSKYIVQFVWVNPNVNTDVLPYIAKSVKVIEQGLNNTILTLKSDDPKVKILYENSYGSGFLKQNSIPNDLDFAVGIYLGEYEFDGKNANEIAKSIDNKMSNFQTELYNYINLISNNDLFTDIDTTYVIQNLNKNSEQNIKSMTANIPHLFDHKPYTIYTDKILYDNDGKEYQMVFPFHLRENEILIEDFAPVELFTDTVTYNNKMKNFLREITIVLDFYVDIKQGDDVVHTEIVAESFTGQRLQLSRRFFVPIVFVGNNSANYLKNLPLLNDDEKYIEYRLFNYKRHLNEFENLKEMQERPVKLFKRVLQCMDLISPVLDKATKNDIEETIQKNLNNPKVIVINDYETSLSNLLNIVSKPTLFGNTKSAGKISMHAEQMTKLVEEIEGLNILNADEMNKLKFFNTKITSSLEAVKTKDQLQALNEYILSNTNEIFTILDGKVQKQVSDYDKIVKYVSVFNKVVEDAGFHIIDVCWLNKNLIGIKRDKYTSQIKDLKQMAKENNMPDVEYKLVNASEFKGPKVRYEIWVRYNQTPQEEKAYNEVKRKLLEDKKNFNVKHKFILKKI